MQVICSMLHIVTRRDKSLINVFSSVELSELYKYHMPRALVANFCIARFCQKIKCLHLFKKNLCCLATTKVLNVLILQDAEEVKRESAKASDNRPHSDSSKSSYSGRSSEPYDRKSKSSSRAR